MTISPGGRKPSGCGFAFVYFTGVTSLSIAGKPPVRYRPAPFGCVRVRAWKGCRGVGMLRGRFPAVRRCRRGRPQCANSGHSQTMRRTGQVDPKRAFKDGPPNGWKARGSGTSAEGLGTLRWFRLGPNFGSIGIGAKRAYGCRSHLSSYRGRAFGMRASGRSSGPPPHEAAPTCRKS
jgi:hypothetical protein